MEKKDVSISKNENKKKYSRSHIEIISFNSQDVLTTSSEGGLLDDFGGIHSEWLKNED